MKNIAIFNTCISGSTGKIAVGLFGALKNSGYNPHFFYGREDGAVCEHYHRVGTVVHKYLHAALAKTTGLQGCGSWIPTISLVRKMAKLEIDTIYIVSPHGYYLNEKILWNYIIRNNVKTIYLMIDEYAYSGNCGYSDGCAQLHSGCKKCPQANTFAKCIGGSNWIFSMKRSVYPQCKDLVFVGPQYTIEQAKESPLMKGARMEVLDEAVNTSFYIPRNTETLKTKLGINADEFVCVCVAPYSYERKGCRFFVELARRFEKDDHYRFVHVGFNVDSKTVDLPTNYIPVDFLTDQNELATYYSLGDLFVFPSLLDTMPNACLEALSSGTPLLCFDTSGMPYIADDSVATFVNPEDVGAMEDVVKNSKKKDDIIIQRCRNYALKRYDNQVYFQRLIEIAQKSGDEE